MKAAVSTAIKTIETQEIPMPVLEPGEALIKVSYCGVCGSDIGGFLRGDPFAPFPHVFGHETSGTIVETCGDCGELKAGDRVVYEITKNCGECPACRAGRRSDCQNVKIIGGHLAGAFAEYVKVPHHLIYKIPDSLPMKLAAACEPYTIAARGIARGKVQAGETVLVLGAGSIALCAVAIAKELGAKVIVVARNADRLENAKAFGPDAVINSKTEDVKARIAELTDGNGCDVILEATGAKAMIEAAVDYAVRATRVVIIGMTMDTITIPALEIITKELQIIGTQNSYDQYPWVIEKLSEGKLHADKFITDVFEYTDAQKALEYAIANSGKCGKVLVKFAD